MDRNVIKMLIASATVVALPTMALAQAVLSDQKDALAHMTNALLAAEQCEMPVDQEILAATMEHAGLASEDLEAEPYKSALATTAQEAETSIEAFGREAVCDRLDAMYGATGLRIPGLITR